MGKVQRVEDRLISLSSSLWPRLANRHYWTPGWTTQQDCSFSKSFDPSCHHWSGGETTAYHWAGSGAERASLGSVCLLRPGGCGGGELVSPNEMKIIDRQNKAYFHNAQLIFGRAGSGSQSKGQCALMVVSQAYFLLPVLEKETGDETEDKKQRRGICFEERNPPSSAHWPPVVLFFTLPIMLQLPFHFQLR